MGVCAPLHSRFNGYTGFTELALNGQKMKNCDHPWHLNPALIFPCPECGATDHNEGAFAIPPSAFSGVLLKPLALENAEGEIVCVPAGAQISIRMSDEAYCDVSPVDITEAVQFLDKL